MRISFKSNLISGQLIRRYKRFLADVRIEGGEFVIAHCPNPGAMTGCMKENCRIWLQKSTNPRRKLKWTWELSDLETAMILVNTQRTNQIILEVLTHKKPSFFSAYPIIKTEVKTEDGSRIDFCLSNEKKRYWLEVKSATYLLKKGVAAFPDSPTKRGAKHLKVLTRKVKGGDRAGLVYVIGRTDATTVVPAVDIDPNYANEVKKAKKAGVDFYCLTTNITTQGIFPLSFFAL